MRKRKYLIGLAAGLALSVAVAGTANAALVYNSQSLVVTPYSPAQDKKAVGPLNSFFTDVITSYTTPVPALPTGSPPGRGSISRRTTCSTRGPGSV